MRKIWRKKSTTLKEINLELHKVKYLIANDFVKMAEQKYEDFGVLASPDTYKIVLQGVPRDLRAAEVITFFYLWNFALM